MITDDELNALLAPSNQPYTGKVENADPISRNLALLGQVNPSVSNEYASSHGRFLSGLGADKMDQQTEKQFDDHADVTGMESQDDVVGSGIFDPFRRPATVNQDMGVFEAKYSIPGNHAREVPFTVNHEIRDIANGADVVGIPSGGLNYVEHGDAMPYLDATNQYEPYARPGVSSKSWNADSVLAPAEKQMAPASPDPRGGQPIPLVADPRLLARQRALRAPGRLDRQPLFQTSQIGEQPVRSIVPTRAAPQRLPQAMTVNPIGMQVSATPYAEPMSRPAAAYMVNPRQPMVRTQAVSGFDLGEAGKWVGILAAGAVVGVAAKLLWPKITGRK